MRSQRKKEKERLISLLGNDHQTRGARALFQSNKRETDLIRGYNTEHTQSTYQWLFITTLMEWRRGGSPPARQPLFCWGARRRNPSDFYRSYAYGRMRRQGSADAGHGPSISLPTHNAGSIVTNDKRSSRPRYE